MRPKGKVFLVGAGPGDPRLLTQRGAELLRQADVVIHDSLVNPALVHLAPHHAEVIGRSPDHPFTQDELNQLLRSRAHAGKCVVRLKGGDPYVFGRGGEEAEALAAAGIPFEVVPGVSAAIAVPAAAGIPVTHRTLASTLTVVTGHQDPAKPGSGVDWSVVARAPGTKVILMGVEGLPAIAQALIGHGQSPETPVAVTQWGTTGQQRTVAGTLADIAGRVATGHVESPAVITLGDVVGLRDKLSWAERRPLFGRRVVVTRAAGQAQELSHWLREEGADVIELPCLRFGRPSRIEPLVEAIGGLGCYDWVVFTSVNGVHSFFEHFLTAYEDLRALGMVRLAAVGPATAEALREYHLRVDLVPGEYTAAAVGKAMAAHESLENLRILLARAEGANPDLPRALEDAGAIVDDIAFYRTVPETEDRTGAGARLRAQGADWITFASGSAVQHFDRQLPLGPLKARWPRLKLASIGPETTRVLATLDLAPDVEAKVHTMPGLVEAIVAAEAAAAK